MTQAKTQYQSAWLSMDDGGVLLCGCNWSVIIKQHMTQAKTQYQNAWFSMDDGGMPSYDSTWSVIIKQHVTQAKTQYQNAWLSMDDGGMLSYDGIWSVIIKQHMTQAKTQYQNAWLSMGDGGMPSYDGTWSVILKQHMTQAKTQYQNVWLSMDDGCMPKCFIEQIKTQTFKKWKWKGNIPSTNNGQDQSSWGIPWCNTAWQLLASRCQAWRYRGERGWKNSKKPWKRKEQDEICSLKQGKGWWCWHRVCFFLSCGCPFFFLSSQCPANMPIFPWTPSTLHQRRVLLTRFWKRLENVMFMVAAWANLPY